MTIALRHGDCLDVMRGMADASIDAVVTDPPYHLTAGKKGGTGMASVNPRSPAGRAMIGTGFNGQAWDGGDVAFRIETWAEVLRLLRPGGHLVAFGGTRTYHRMVCAIEDAGFEIRDQLAWLYGSGFPKSCNLPDGRGTALKPAHEPICLARKPLVGTVAANVARHGTGALNIDSCRIEAEGGSPSAARRKLGAPTSCRPGEYGHTIVNRIAPERFEQERPGEALGRWPANVTHDGSDEVLEAFAAFGDRGAAAPVRGTEPSAAIKNAYNDRARVPGAFHGDTGTAARFFFSAKANREERGEGNTHPTVKPLALMQWLCRLVTPPGGTVLDPFAGSGSTLIAADREGFDAVGIEHIAEYVEIARRRLNLDSPLFACIA